MQIGMIGLGRMGGNMVRRLLRARHDCVVYDRAPAAVETLVGAGAGGAGSLQEFVGQLRPPRAVFVMLPAGVVDSTISELAPLLAEGDIIVDGGNSHFQDDIARAKRLAADGVHYVDMGTSGGVWGLERGYCLMLGGEPDVVASLDPIFRALAPGPGTIPRTRGVERLADVADGTVGVRTAESGYLHCGPSGAGHFVKMIHNGIEYGLMAAYAEGFNILRHANAGGAAREHSAESTPLRTPEHYRYDFDLGAIAEVWRRGSVITSWLLDLAATAFMKNPTLDEFAGRVSDSGEGRWTVQAANDLAVPAHVLAASLFERFASRGEDDFQNRVLSAMRLGFGGHSEQR